MQSTPGFANGNRKVWVGMGVSPTQATNPESGRVETQKKEVLGMEPRALLMPGKHSAPEPHSALTEASPSASRVISCHLCAGFPMFVEGSRWLVLTEGQSN